MNPNQQQQPHTQPLPLRPLPLPSPAPAPEVRCTDARLHNPTSSGMPLLSLLVLTLDALHPHSLAGPPVAWLATAGAAPDRPGRPHRSATLMVASQATGSPPGNGCAERPGLAPGQQAAAACLEEMRAVRKGVTVTGIWLYV